MKKPYDMVQKNGTKNEKISYQIKDGILIYILFYMVRLEWNEIFTWYKLYEFYINYIFHMMEKPLAGFFEEEGKKKHTQTI